MMNIKVALKLRAEREIAEGRLEDAKVTVLEMYDMEEAGGYMSPVVFSLMNEINRKEAVVC